ncbi:C40 family peptidase [Bacteroides pyogenes]|uniref:C40 family peptidase n=1 Tax=Bacteroides pyogenes TaxID=310300 RepID=UPI003B430015
MRRSLTYIGFIGTILVFASCRTTAPQFDYTALARASIVLGMDIRMEDHHPLYLEAAEWMGVPYRGGGNSKQGTDCSGLVYSIYRKAYRTRVTRSSEELKAQSRKISKSNLQEGDLVFFSNHRSSKRVGHVGIYLKDRKFIHASTGRGVIISSLDEPYYRKHWISGGRVR